MKKILLSFIAIFAICSSFATTYYSQGSVIMTTLANWNSNRIGGGTTPGNFTTSGDIFVVQGSIANGGGGAADHSMFTSGTSLTFGANVKLWLEGGSTVTTAAAITINATGTFQMDNGSTFIHNHTGAISALFNGTEIIGATSNFNVTATASIAAGAVVSAPGLGNFTYSGGASMQCNGAFPNLQGNLTVTTAALRLNGGGTSGLSTTISGNLIISGTGQLEYGNGSANGYTINLLGNLNVSSSSATPILFAATGGTAGTPVTANLNFAKAGTQTFTVSSSALIGSNTANFRYFYITINNGSTVDFGTSVLNSTASMTVNFTVASGGGIITANTGGITAANTASGSIQNLAGTRTYNLGNYTYNGSSPQVTGTGLPATVTNLTINNTSGVTLNNTGASVQVNGTLALTNGIFNTITNSAVVVVPSGASVTRTNGWVYGSMQKYVSGSTNFEVGDNTYYTNVNVSGTISTPGLFTVKTNPNGDHPNIGTSTLDATKSENTYWTLTNNAVTFGSGASLVFNYPSGDIDGGATATYFVLGNYNGGTWTYPGSITAAANSMSVTGITTFGDFQSAEQASNTITTDPSATITGPYCAGAAIAVPYTIVGTFSGTNTFTAQLSNSSGSFASGVTTLVV